MQVWDGWMQVWDGWMQVWWMVDVVGWLRDGGWGMGAGWGMGDAGVGGWVLGWGFFFEKVLKGPSLIRQFFFLSLDLGKKKISDWHRARKKKLKTSRPWSSF